MEQRNFKPQELPQSTCPKCNGKKRITRKDGDDKDIEVPCDCVRSERGYKTK